MTKLESVKDLKISKAPRLRDRLSARDLYVATSMIHQEFACWRMHILIHLVGSGSVVTQ